jgi:hypothetical protein
VYGCLQLSGTLEFKFRDCRVTINIALTSPNNLTPSRTSCIQPLNRSCLAVIGFSGVQDNLPWFIQCCSRSKFTGAHTLAFLKVTIEMPGTKMNRSRQHTDLRSLAWGTSLLLASDLLQTQPSVYHYLNVIFDHYDLDQKFLHNQSPGLVRLVFAERPVNARNRKRTGHGRFAEIWALEKE